VSTALSASRRTSSTVTFRTVCSTGAFVQPLAARRTTALSSQQERIIMGSPHVGIENVSLCVLCTSWIARPAGSGRRHATTRLRLCPPPGVSCTSRSALRAGRTKDTSHKAPLIERSPHTAGDTRWDVAASIERAKVSRLIPARIGMIQFPMRGSRVTSGVPIGDMPAGRGACLAMVAPQNDVSRLRKAFNPLW
jgi:hypothetical protein